MSDEAVHVRLTQLQNYQFNIEFGGAAPALSYLAAPECICNEYMQ